MMYMPDAIKATLNLMQAPSGQVQVRSGYNLAGFSASPEEIAESIRHHIPGFRINYQPDFRQEIADSWPNSIDDATAKNDWGWQPLHDLHSMTADILRHLPDYLHRLKSGSTTT